MTEKPKFDPKLPLTIQPATVGMEDVSGNLVFKRPTLKDEIEIGIELSQLTRNVQFASDYYLTIANVLATFNVVCIGKPEGFDFGSYSDPEAILRVYTKYLEWLEFFRKDLREGKNRASEERVQVG